jgi:hypothetical protein
MPCARPACQSNVGKLADRSAVIVHCTILRRSACFSHIVSHLLARLSAADHLGSTGGLRDGFGLASPWVSPKLRETPIKSGLDVPMASAFQAPPPG